MNEENPTPSNAFTFQDEKEHHSRPGIGSSGTARANQLRELWTNHEKTPSENPVDKHSEIHFPSLIQYVKALEISPGKAIESTTSSSVTSSITYSRPKSDLGGSDMGLIGRIGDTEYLIKTGIGRSLLNQIIQHYGEKNSSLAEKKIGYLAGGFRRALSLSEIKKEDEEKELNRIFNDFLKTDEGKKLLDKAKDRDLDIGEVNALHVNLVKQDPQLRNILGIPIVVDIINGTCSQALINAFHSRKLSPEHIPDSHLVMAGNIPYISSRLLQKSKPFDAYLLSMFLPDGMPADDVRAAAALIKKARRASVAQEELEAAKNTIDKVCSAPNIAQGKERLAAQLSAHGMDDLFSSILMRLTLGESADIGPDNMLVIEGEGKRNKLVNIDATGFRYEREQDLQGGPQNPVRHGWKKIVENPVSAAEPLLDKSVFNNRYMESMPAVHDAIVDVIKETLSQNAQPEVKQLKGWYASLDANKVADSMRELGKILSERLDPRIAPDPELLSRLIERNCTFVFAAVSRCRPGQEQDDASSPVRHAPVPPAVEAQPH